MKLFQQLEARRNWSPQERLALDQVRRLSLEMVAPNAARYDRSGDFPSDNIEALNTIGLNTIFIPEAYGGAPMPYRLYLAVVRTLAEACASTAIIYATTFHALKPLIDFGSEEQKQRLLPGIAKGGLGAITITEANAGSDATGMQTRFRQEGDSIIVNGDKIFVTNGDVADLLLVFGKWDGIEDSKASISALYIERGSPGMRVLRLEDKMGLRASSTAAIAFDGCRVPRANMLGEPGQGLRILLSALNKSRPSIAAHALGIAHAAFNDMVKYMNQRRQSNRRIIEFQGNQFSLADLASDLAMAECWLDYVAGLMDDGVHDLSVEASIAKLRISDLAMRITTEAVQMHGGYGYCRDYRVERLMREAKVTQIWEGTNQIHRQLIGRSFITR